ncbi:MAG: hypothetical protein E2O63_00055 [Gammaproteobacteria bacterium]|nr:MAG: hypothetical protein E2O63_00055 [Gammaproteobacteria bacterium]
MSGHNCHCKDAYQDRLFTFAGHTRSPVMLARQHGFEWRQMLARLARPMLRLHHLRNIRTQMLDDALEDLDGCKSAGRPQEDA